MPDKIRIFPELFQIRTQPSIHHQSNITVTSHVNTVGSGHGYVESEDFHCTENLKPHTNHKRSSVSSHTLAPTSICDFSHSLCWRPLTRSGSHKLSHLRLSSFVVCLWSQKGNFDVSPNEKDLLHYLTPEIPTGWYLWR